MKTLIELTKLAMMLVGALAIWFVALVIITNLLVVVL